MTDKNHEQYLEQIETAVAETTMDILEKHSGDLRAMAKLVAEKQVEINRLKEYYSEDKKTIRSLRVKLNGAVEELDGYKEELDVAHHEYDKLKKEIDAVKEEVNDRVVIEDIADAFGSEEGEDFDWESEIGGMVKENEELKEEIELQKDYIDAIPHKVEEYKDELHAVMGENRMLKDEIKELKKGDKRKLKKKVEELEKRLDEEYSDYDTEVEMRHKAEKELEKLQNEHEGICSKYHADFCELEEKREEVIRLNKFKESAISQVNSHLEQIVELKKENKKLKEQLK